MNWLDKGIAAIAPAWGLRRVQARAALNVVRHYEAAGAGSRKSTTWTTSGSSANAATTSVLSKVRNNTRDLVRNNPYAARAVEIWTAKAIGTGIRARWPKHIQKAWNAWAKRCDYDGQLDLYGIEGLVARAEFESGELLVRRVWEKNGDAAPLKLQVLEPDYIDSTKWGVSGDNVILSGIEIDRRGRRVAYWLFDTHPGELVCFPRMSMQSRRHLAADILHFYKKRRPGQMRAVSRLAPCVTRIRDQDEYQEAVRVLKKIQACFVGFVHGGTAAVPLGEASTNPQTGERNETMSPGLIQYLKQGEDVTFGTPPSSDDSTYTSDELHAIAVGCGLTYEQLTGDLKGVNLSSIRSGMQDFRDVVESWRWLDFIPMFCGTIEAWFLEAAWTGGQIRSRDHEPIWTAPRWPYMQPVDDIKASKEEIRAGLASTSEKLRELGYDPDEVFAEIAEEREKLKKAGIVVDTDPATPAKPASSGEGGDEGKKKDDEEVDDETKRAVLDLVREL